MLNPDTTIEINIIAKTKEPTILYSGCTLTGINNKINFSPIIMRTNVTMIALTIRSKNSLKYIVTPPPLENIINCNYTFNILYNTTYQLRIQ